MPRLEKIEVVGGDPTRNRASNMDSINDYSGKGKRFYTWKELSQLNSKETAHVAYEGKVCIY